MKQVGIHTRGAVCFVDDEESFLDSMRMIFETRYEVICFTSPLQAIERLKKDNKYLIDEERHLATITGTEDAPLLFRRVLRWLLEKSHRKVIQTCFADFWMPAMNGVELLSAIPNSRIQRILVTGHGNAVSAVKAFNAGQIDAYLLKHEDNLASQISKFAVRGARRKLDGIWRKLDLEIQEGFESQSMRDAVLERLQKMKVVDYFLLPQPSGYLCLTASDEVKWLQLDTHETQVGAVEVLGDAGAPHDVLEDLRSGAITAALEFPLIFPGIAGQDYPTAPIQVVSTAPWIGISEFDIPRAALDQALAMNDPED